MPSLFSCMIVDDEPDAIDFLAGMIREHAPVLNIVATAGSSEEAIRKYIKTLPDLVFMDIEVDGMNGFDIIREICSDKIKPRIIFVTGYNRYAIEAFKTNAIGYLLKPVGADDLKRSVDRFTETKELEMSHEKLWNFIRDYTGKIRFNTSTGFVMVHPSEILYCEADHNYSKIYTLPDKSILVSVNLAVVEDMLGSTEFCRISRSVLINSRYLSSVHRRNKTCTLLWQGMEIVLPASSDMIRKL